MQDTQLGVILRPDEIKNKTIFKKTTHNTLWGGSAFEVFTLCSQTDVGSHD